MLWAMKAFVDFAVETTLEKSTDPLASCMICTPSGSANSKAAEKFARRLKEAVGTKMYIRISRRVTEACEDNFMETCVNGNALLRAIIEEISPE